MKAAIYLLIPLFCLCMSTSLAQTYIGDEEEIDQILKNTKVFSQHVMNSDYDRIAQAYTTDGKIMPNGPEIITGHDKIKAYWTLPEGTSTIYHEVSPEEIKIIDDHAYDYGYYKGTTRKPDGTEVSWKGKYVIVWRKEGNDWKIYLDIWNRVN